MSDSGVGKALIELRKLKDALSEIIEALEDDNPEEVIVYKDLDALIIAELEKCGSLLDYEIIQRLEKHARRGKNGPETTVWQSIENGLRVGKWIADKPLAERTLKMKKRKETPKLEDRYYGYRISLPEKEKH